MLHKVGVDRSNADAVARLSFDLTHETIVSVKIVDEKQRIVEVLIEGLLPTGHHDITWFGRTELAEHTRLVFDTPTDHREVNGRSITLR